MSRMIDRVQVLVLSLSWLGKNTVLLASVAGVTGTLGVWAVTVQPIDVTTSIVAIGMLCTAVGTLYTAIHTARIGSHVDGMATAAAAKRTADEDTIISLKQQLADSETRAALLAQARANVDIATAVPSVSKGPTL